MIAVDTIRARRPSPATPRRLLGVAALIPSLLLGIAFAGWWTYLRPVTLGGDTTFVIVSGRSMEPTFESGDLVVVRRRPSYAVGDVVAFRTNAAGGRGQPLVIHRVVDVRADGRLVLQGDNNGWLDPWNPRPEDVAGSYQFDLDGVGAVVHHAVLHPVLPAATIAGLATFMVMLGHGRARQRRRAAGEIDLAGPAFTLLWVGGDRQVRWVGTDDRRRRQPVPRTVGLLVVGLVAVVGGVSGKVGSASWLQVDAGTLQFVRAIVGVSDDEPGPPSSEADPPVSAAGDG